MCACLYCHCDILCSWYLPFLPAHPNPNPKSPVRPLFPPDLAQKNAQLQIPTVSRRLSHLAPFPSLSLQQSPLPLPLSPHATIPTTSFFLLHRGRTFLQNSYSLSFSFFLSLSHESSILILALSSLSVSLFSRFSLTRYIRSFSLCARVLNPA